MGKPKTAKEALKRLNRKLTVGELLSIPGAKLMDTSKYKSYEEWRNDSVIIRPDIKPLKKNKSGKDGGDE